MQHILIERREIYGNRVFYPVCDTAKTFAAIAKSKTLTVDTLKLIKSLGFDIRIQFMKEEF